MDKATESKHKTFPSIYRKIRNSFAIMTFAMFSLFWSVIYVAENQLEVISLHHWLDTEASRYIEEYKTLGDKAVLPHEGEFSTYWSKQPLPNWLQQFQSPGFYEYLLGEEDKHFIVTPHPSGDGLMYIVFKDDADDYLDEYELSLHNFTFLMGGIISLVMIVYGFYLVRSLSKPLNHIEEKITQMPPDQPTFNVETAFAETRHIEQTLLDSKNHISGFFQREKEFSRFASHELRTPIMVIKGSSDLLAKIPEQPPIANKAIKRLLQASDQMRVLTEAFLLLGKEAIEPHHLTEQNLAQALTQQLDEMAPLFAKQNCGYSLRIDSTHTLLAPESFVTIVINNLIKNAFSYSVGDIEINLTDHELVICNQHDGNETYNAGYGCGLVIVQRISERMGWQFETSEHHQYFTAKVRFN
ncbi:sensor histidine kinase [Vibrio sp. TRT 17S01]|uniref:sensor histidine kinase n=1 Tax=Vibrio sp. TRT 17S01 TaxID=3418505 RepID=UPI003CF37EE1